MGIVAIFAVLMVAPSPSIETTEVDLLNWVSSTIFLKVLHFFFSVCIIAVNSLHAAEFELAWFVIASIKALLSVTRAWHGFVIVGIIRITKVLAKVLIITAVIVLSYLQVDVCLLALKT